MRGSNGYRTWLWKVELQGLAEELGLAITVCHFPPGTRKWNKIEHRLFSFISKNWRGRPLDSLATIVNLISHTRTEAGLYVEASLDYATYEKGIKVSDAQMEELHLKRDKDFNGSTYRVNKAELFQAVGKPNSAQNIGGEVIWYWDCRGGTLQAGVTEGGDTVTIFWVNQYGK